MSQEAPPLPQEQPKDFFISYTGKDSTWAEWIAFELEEAGYTTVIQAWDSRPGMNFVGMMDEATQGGARTIAVLSEAYLQSNYAFAEWAEAFREDPKGKQGQLVPVRIEACTVKGLPGPIVYIDVVGLDEQKAREQLLAGVKRDRAKPLSVAFPGSIAPRPSGPLTLERPSFPGSLPPIWNVPYPRNALFTGREELLTQLAASLHTGQPTAISQPPKDSQPQAISGLAGIGKTQTALEYAYRYRSEYQAVLWVQAETKDSLTSSYLEIARLLNLPEKEAQESSQVITEEEPLVEQALAIYEHELGSDHPWTATSLNNLAGLYYSQRKYEQAEPLYERALTIRQQTLGQEHPDTAQSQWWLATLARQHNRITKQKGSMSKR